MGFFSRYISYFGTLNFGIMQYCFQKDYFIDLITLFVQSKNFPHNFSLPVKCIKMFCVQTNDWDKIQPWIRDPKSIHEWGKYAGVYVWKLQIGTS